MDTLERIFHVNFLGYSYRFISIRISQLKGHSISVDQSIYSRYVVAKYLNTATINEKPKFHNTTLPHDMIFTTEDNSTSDEQVKVLSREYNIH